MTDEARSVAVATPARPSDALTTPARWWQGYSTRLVVTDVAAVGVAVLVAYAIRFDADGSARVGGQLTPTYLAVSIALLWGWVAALVVGPPYAPRLVGSGPGEYQRVFSVTWRLFATVAVVAYLGRMEIGRGYLAIAAPLGLVLLLAGRYLWRQQLWRHRRQGRALARVLVVGHRRRAEAVVAEMVGRPASALHVVGVCLPAEDDLPTHVADVPVVGSTDDVVLAARRLGADVVAVIGSDGMTPDAVRELGWDLEGSGIDLAVMATYLRDVAMPRVMMQPVSGLSLLYVDEARFSGTKYALKSVVDWLGALVGVVVLSPLLLVLAALVKASSPGPVLYRQQRVGVNGEPFLMLKFRTMEVGADRRLDEVLAAEGVDDVGLFYKPKNDPRVTRVGRVLRRYSLDELPQLANVLRGEMALVGPRPQIDREVAQYDRTAGRRLLVKPGLTGLWQVSGRNDLEAADGIRLDVYYAENWTLFGDLLLIGRTLGAIVSNKGAY